MRRTATGDKDRSPATNRWRTDKILTGLIMLLGSQLCIAAEIQWQAPDTLVTAASHAVESNYTRTADSMEVVITSPDPRLRLRQCGQPLHAETLSANAGQRRLTIKVQCTDTPGWKVYLQATIRRFDKVLVARRNLARGHVITDDDVGYERLDTSTLHAGFYRDAQRVTGQRLIRTLTAGSVLTGSDMREVPVVKRGQTVNLISEGAAIRIKMAGSALADGGRGQRIRVRNSSSGRVIEGVVKDSSTVIVK